MVALRADGEDAARLALVDLVERAERIRRALNDLEYNIRTAAGGDKHDWDKGGHLGDETMPMFAQPTEGLLTHLQRHAGEREAALLAWDEQVAEISWARANEALDGAPISAFAGRKVSNDRMLRLADAEAFYRKAILEALPNLADKSRENRKLA